MNNVDRWWWERCPNYQCSQADWSKVFGPKLWSLEFKGLYMTFIFLLHDWNDRKLELLLLVVLTLLKIKFEHTQIIVRKVDITMSKTAWINPLSLVDSSNRIVKWSHTMILVVVVNFFWRIWSLIILSNWQCLIYFKKICLKLNGGRKLRFKTQWKIQFLPLLYGWQF